jgi:hypothetical protein
VPSSTTRRDDQPPVFNGHELELVATAEGGQVELEKAKLRSRLGARFEQAVRQSDPRRTITG